MRWNRRIGVGAALAVAVVGVTGGASYAALSKAQVSPGHQEASAVDTNGVKISTAQSSTDGAPSWSLINVSGNEPLKQTPNGWTGQATLLGNLANTVNVPLQTGCTSGGVTVPVVNQNVRACAQLLPTGVYPSDAYGSAYGAVGFAFVGAGNKGVAVSVLSSQTDTYYSDCPNGGAFASPLEVDVINGDSFSSKYPAGNAKRGC